MPQETETAAIIGDAPRDFFAHCPRCGVSAMPERERGPKSFACAACGFVLYFNIGCAVGGLIADRAGRLLVVRRAREPSRGLLGFPGGFVDAGETAEDALRREVREEVGMDIEILRGLGSNTNQYAYKGVTYPTLDFFYVCRSVSPSPEGMALTLQETEIAGFAWRDPDHITSDEIAFPSMRWALARYRESR